MPRFISQLMELLALLLILVKLKCVNCSSFDGLLQATCSPSGRASNTEDAAFCPPAFDLRESQSTNRAFEALADGSIGPTAVGIQGRMSATKTGTTIVGVIIYTLTLVLMPCTCMIHTYL